MCQILNLKKYNASEIELKILQRFRSYLKENTTRQVLNIKIYNVSDFKTRKTQCFRFWNKKLTCQPLK